MARRTPAIAAVRLTDREKRQVQAWAAAHGTTESELLRLAVGAVLRTRRQARAARTLSAVERGVFDGLPTAEARRRFLAKRAKPEAIPVADVKAALEIALGDDPRGAVEALDGPGALAALREILGLLDVGAP